MKQGVVKVLELQYPTFLDLLKDVEGNIFVLDVLLTCFIM